jgi:hypothetical protein
MAKRSSGPIHVIKFPLIMNEADVHFAEKSFYAIYHLHNVTVSRVITLFHVLDCHTTYQSLRKEYNTILKQYENTDAKKIPKEVKARKTELSKQMTDIRTEIGLTDYGLQAYIGKCRKQNFAHLVSSSQAQKEATRVWDGVADVLFKKGNKVHYKKLMETYTIPGKNPTNGVEFNKENMTIEWMHRTLKCVQPKDPDDIWYVKESLDHDICYCEIKREMFPSGWNYYVIVTLKGPAPQKPRKVGTGRVGIDPGVSTIAAVSYDGVLLEELAPKAKEYNQKIQQIQRKMDRSKRATNPNKYDEKGNIKKDNNDKWIYSKNYKRLRQELKSLYRQKAAYIKQSHEEQANRILAMGNQIYVEKTDFRALQKRAKDNGKQENLSIIKTADGTEKEVHKNKKRKRFGSSISNRAPSKLLTILKRKAIQSGGSYTEIDCKVLKASQYDHTTDTYTKVPLSQREKEVGGHIVQRDLYSGFLIFNVSDDLTYVDIEKCNAFFETFVVMQDACIETMKQANISYKPGFGF